MTSIPCEDRASLGVKFSQSRTACMPSWSSATTWWVTPFGYIISTPPSWSWEVYTGFPRSRLSAEKPVRIMGAWSRWMTRCPRRFRYAPMPTDRPVTYDRVKVSS